jgi:hypothetical protein
MQTSDGKKSKSSRNEEPRESNSNPWDPNLEFEQINPGDAFSEKIPEVWKNQTFIGTSFTIEKCRDLK